VTFLNFAINFWGSTKQQNISGVPQADYEKSVGKLDDALGKLRLTEEEKTNTFIQFTKTKAELNSVVAVVSGFLQLIYHDTVTPDKYPTAFFKLFGDWRDSEPRVASLDDLGDNISPTIDGLRQEAKQAYAAGQIAKTLYLLDRIDREKRLGIFLDDFEEYLKRVSAAKDTVSRIDSGTLPSDFVINAPWLGIDPKKLVWEDSKFLPLDLGLRIKKALYNAMGSNGLMFEVRSGSWVISKSRDGNGFVYYRFEAAEEEGQQTLMSLREFACQPKWIDDLPLNAVDLNYITASLDSN
jgi:hypothetical protein